MINYCNLHQSIPREFLINPFHYYEYGTLPGLNDVQKNRMIELYGYRFKEVVFVHNTEELKRYHGKDGAIEYNICFDINFFYPSFVQEQIGMFSDESGEAFTQMRDTVYVWVGRKF
jgi:hypothetical protein